MQIVPEDLPPLTLDPDVLRRVASLGPFSPLTAVPALLGGLLRLDMDAPAALDVCIRKALAAADLDPREGDRPRQILRRLSKEAKRVRRVVLQLRTLSGVTTRGCTGTLSALTQLERAADAAGSIVALTRLDEVIESLPDEALPWFEPAQSP